MISEHRILVFGAHCDDEIVGPGGTIAKFAGQGAEVLVVTFTGGTQETGYSRPELRDVIAQMRLEEAKRADDILGIKKRIFLGKPTQGVTNDRETYQECVKIIRQFRPTMIFTHYFKDKHRDHRAISALTEEARWKSAENVLADFGKPWYTPKMFFYELLELFTSPSHVIDITDTLDRKIAAMKSQTSQLEVLPRILEHIEGLAKVRGSAIGVKYAEAFLDSHLWPQKEL